MGPLGAWTAERALFLFGPVSVLGHLAGVVEKLFGGKVMLTLWVKVKGGWSDDERALRSLGYGDL